MSEQHQEELRRLRRRYEREQAAREQAEALLESKSRELYVANQELTSLTEDLEAQVQQRTSELKVARDQAIAHSETKTLFLAHMSHEIRTPMNALLGFISLLSDERLDKRQRRLLDTARTSGELLLTIINDILDVSKIETGEIELEAIPFDLTELLANSADGIQMLAQQKGVELIVAASPSLPRLVVGDPTRLRQVLNNLLSNAVKFTEVGEIVLKAERDQSDAEAITIAVTDTGVGLTSDQIDRIFLPFSQADNSITRKFGGTGLGLSICKHFAVAMGGEIRVQSEPGQGSTFSFTVRLPFADPRPKIAEGLDIQGVESGVPKSLLIVDDNVTAATVLREQLQSLDYFDSIICAYDAEEAEAALTRLESDGEPVDLIIIDQFLDGQADDRTASRLANNLKKQGRSVPQIWALTSMHRQNAAEAFDHVIAKPVHLPELSAAIRHLFSVGVATAVQQAEPEMAPSGRKLQRPFDGRCVLLVDDNAANREIGMEFLRLAGFSVDTCSNGLEALALAEVNTYDVILMDVQMPVMDGLTASRQIHARGGRLATIPIIAMTAYAEIGDIQKSLAAGMVAHLTKPIRRDELFKVLEELLPAEY